MRDDPDRLGSGRHDRPGQRPPHGDHVQGNQRRGQQYEWPRQHHAQSDERDKQAGGPARTQSQSGNDAADAHRDVGHPKLPHLRAVT